MYEPGRRRMSPPSSGTATVLFTDLVGSTEIRVGLSLGEVTLEDGDVFGAPVVEAATRRERHSARSGKESL